MAFIDGTVVNVALPALQQSLHANVVDVQWVIEAQAPNSIFTEGYRKNSFKPGDVVTVTANPVTNGRPYGRFAGVVLADGTTIGNVGGGGRGGGRGRGAPAQ